MRFDSPQTIKEVASNIRDAEKVRARNRALIDMLFNGAPPYDAEEARANNIEINVNFKEATVAAHDARRQWFNAFFKAERYFTLRTDKGPMYERHKWAAIVTNEMNRILKASLEYLETQRSKFASVVLHGIGPVIWCNQNDWCPRMVPLSDLLIPAFTRLDLSNLTHFGVLRHYTPAELQRYISGRYVDGRWNVPMVKQILKVVAEKQLQNSTQNLDPERVVELIRQNAGYYNSDCVPRIPILEWYYKEDEGDGWYRKLILDPEDDLGVKGDDFLYDSKTTYADSLSHILHLQIGDGNNVPPFLYHSVRGLGFILYDIAHLQNRLRSRFYEHVFEQMMMLFRITDPADRDRLQKVDLINFGIVPEGLQWVPGAERYAADFRIINAAFSELRQLMAENAASFTQDVDTGTRKEMTATEVMARVNSVNALVSSMLAQGYVYETFAYREIARRFFKRNSVNDDVKLFQERCRAQGVPEKMFDIEYWEVEPERVLGGGNKVLEIAQAKELMAIRPMLDPTAQNEVLRIYILAITDDPALVDRLAPLPSDQVSDAVHDAELSFGTMMQGIPVRPKAGINHIETIETLLQMLGARVARVEQEGGVPEPDVLVGLQTVLNSIVEHIQILGQNPAEKQRVKVYMDNVSNIANMLRAYEQRLAEKMQAEQQAGGGLPPETMAKIASMQAVAQAKAANLRETHAQRSAMRQVEFEREQQRRDIMAWAEAQRKLQEAKIKAAAKDIETRAKLLRETPQFETTTTEQPEQTELQP